MRYGSLIERSIRWTIKRPIWWVVDHPITWALTISNALYASTDCVNHDPHVVPGQGDVPLSGEFHGAKLSRGGGTNLSLAVGQAGFSCLCRQSRCFPHFRFY